MSAALNRLSRLAAGLGLAAALLYFLVLPGLGHLLVESGSPGEADAAIVLSTGVDYYPRLIEAAALYREGRVPRVVINGDRKTAALRELEARGFERAAPWDEDSRRILELLGVPRERVLAVPAEDAYDTISEARALAPVLGERGLTRLAIVTSRFHTRRAAHVWRHRAGRSFHVVTAPARRDPFDPAGWWRSGRQIRQLLGEYGGWLLYFVTALTGPDTGGQSSERTP
jgi:uncharacterized SAM-binding protein YcdF (DUF218 family)